MPSQQAGGGGDLRTSRAFSTYHAQPLPSYRAENALTPITTDPITTHHSAMRAENIECRTRNAEVGRVGKALTPFSGSPRVLRGPCSALDPVTA